MICHISISNANVWTHAPSHTQLPFYLLFISVSLSVSSLFACVSLPVYTYSMPPRYWWWLFSRSQFADSIKVKRYAHANTQQSCNISLPVPPALTLLPLFCAKNEFIEIKCTYHWIHRCVNSFLYYFLSVRHMIVGYSLWNHRFKL